MPQKDKPIHERQYDIFLSHASADKKSVVNDLYKWLQETCDLRVWYDQICYPAEPTS